MCVTDFIMTCQNKRHPPYMSSLWLSLYLFLIIINVNPCVSADFTQNLGWQHPHQGHNSTISLKHWWWSYSFTHTLTPPTHKHLVFYPLPSPQESHCPTPLGPSVYETETFNSYIFNSWSLTIQTVLFMYSPYLSFYPQEGQTVHPQFRVIK